MEKHSLKRYAIILLLLPFLLGGAPSRTKTYTTGEVISASDVTENEDNLFRYVQQGVDTYADSTIVSADITDGTIVNADISSSAAIAYSKLNLSSSITSSDITDSTIAAGDIGALTTIDINGGTIDGITALTVANDVDIGSYELRAQTLESDVATGTAPFTIASTTVSTNLNADLLDGIDSTSIGLSNVIFCWIGSVNAATNSYGMVEGTSLTPNMGAYTVNYHFFGVTASTARTILTGRFVKIAGISTITIHANLWSSNAGATAEAVLTVDVGGQSNTVKSVTSTTPTWVTTSTISVSGLTNGTAYDITIQLNNEDGSYDAYCAGVILTGS